MKKSTLLIRAGLILAIALGIVIFAQITLNMHYADPMFIVSFMPYEIVLAVVALQLWFLLLRKEVPLRLEPLAGRTFWMTLPIVFITLAIIITTLVSSDTLDYTLFAYFFATALFVGIAEEIIFRGVGFGSLLALGMSPKKAIFLSALIFSMFHLTNLLSGLGISIIVQLINTFMLGVVLAFIYWETKSILYVVLIHFLWDLSSFTAQTFTSFLFAGVILLSISIVYFIWTLNRLSKL